MNSMKTFCGMVATTLALYAAAPSGVDFNKDGIDDLLVHNAENGQVYSWLMKSDGTRTAYSFVATIPSSDWTIEGMGDFNGDGITDVLVRNTGNGQVYSWLMKSDGTRSGYKYITKLSSDWEIAGTDSDFNKDGINDIVVRNKREGWTYIWIMEKSGSRSTYKYVTTIPEADWQIAGTDSDFNGDGVSDIVVRNRNHGWTYVWLMNSDGSRSSYEFITTLPESDWEIAGTDSDFNKDGISDIVVRNTTHGWTYVWLMKEDGTRERYNYITTLPSDIWEIAGTDSDFNGDGTSDLVVRKQGSGAVYVWLMKSDGTRDTYRYVTAIPASEWKIVKTTCNFDKDGSSDIVVMNTTTGAVYSWRMNTDGTRKDVAVIATIFIEPSTTFDPYETDPAKQQTLFPGHTMGGWVNIFAFAALKNDGTVVTWGYAYNGGDSSGVVGQLTNVETLYSTHYAFAALKSDGTVVTWGSTDYGGDSSDVASQLTSVEAVYSTDRAFAALKSDGTVVTWGSEYAGGDSSDVAGQLSNVETIYSTQSAFAALKSDGTVVTWGYADYGGDSSGVAGRLTNVEAVYSTGFAFAALKSDGTVVTWGYADYGGDSSDVASQLTSVEAVYSTDRAFAALKSDGTVVTWGYAYNGGDSSGVVGQLTNVKTLYSTHYAFAALKSDGTVVTWGSAGYGGDSSGVAGRLTNVEAVYVTEFAFAALKSDGTVVTWGSEYAGGDSSDVADQLSNVEAIYSNARAFAALKHDGTVVTWGDAEDGGDSSEVASKLTNVETIYSTGYAFAALKSDRTVVTWGDADFGGDSSGVIDKLREIKLILPFYTRLSRFSSRLPVIK